LTQLVFLDTETTSLRPDRRAWDIGLIVRDSENGDTEYNWYVDAADLDLGNADLAALKIGRFYDRHPYYTPIASGDPWDSATDREAEVLTEVERFTRGATIVGAVPNFDTEVLGARMRAHDICPSWHYHIVDIETLAAGALKQPPPWGFDDLLAVFGLTYTEEDRHTALGDARMVRDLYDAVLGSPAVRA